MNFLIVHGCRCLAKIEVQKEIQRDCIHDNQAPLCTNKVTLSGLTLFFALVFFLTS